MSMWSTQRFVFLFCFFFFIGNICWLMETMTAICYNNNILDFFFLIQSSMYARRVGGCCLSFLVIVFLLFCKAEIILNLFQ